MGKNNRNAEVYLRCLTISPNETDPEGLSITMVTVAPHGVTKPEEPGESDSMSGMASSFRFINDQSPRNALGRDAAQGSFT